MLPSQTQLQHGLAADSGGAERACQQNHPSTMHKLGKKPRSKTGCRTCRIRKVKCDEEKLPVEGKTEPQCRRCSAARILCEWKGGPIPRRSSTQAPGSSKSKNSSGSEVYQERKSSDSALPLLPATVLGNANGLQAANSLCLSAFDRKCLEYLQDSALVTVLGKHWPWSTIAYTYHRVAVKEPMVMSMILASTASEIHRARVHDQDQYGLVAAETLANVDGRVHYGRALAHLREALKQNVQSAAKLEAVFITLWLMVDYEGRFGSGNSAINIHIRGIESVLYDHVVPLLKNDPPIPAITSGIEAQSQAQPGEDKPQENDLLDKSRAIATNQPPTPTPAFDSLRCTSVPLFLLWTLYFYTPGAIFCGPGAKLDPDLFRSFLNARTDISLTELYKISRQSPSRFWGDGYPATAQLDDLENLPGLTLYHRSHVTSFQITELYRQEPTTWSESSAARIMDEIIAISEEYDILLTSANSAPSCEIVSDGRRVLETIYWSSITYYSTIVYFYLCFQDKQLPLNPRFMSLPAAVSRVLELSLKLHRSRPRVMVRIVWPLFIAGIATTDRIYQDWVSIRLREIGRYGLNYSRVSSRFDEIIRGGDLFG